MLNNYNKIAVAIDFSEQSLKASERAKNIAINNNATLQLVNVVDTTFGSVAAYDLDYAGNLKEESQKKMNELKSRMEAEGVASVEIVIKDGSPKDVLTDLPNVDLLICGATGVSGLEKMVIGSVAEGIVRHASCEVLIVK